MIAEPMPIPAPEPPDPWALELIFRFSYRIKGKVYIKSEKK
ncbi:hypothetical protein D5b_00044 [Faustovirus]|nr:hypothetical protein D5b_00044 [Faustovirus]AMN84865.1 hypothetical protein D6_00466 [Faustovirus]AMP44003.1 hypothetical protein PRJ_Dakar_00043 [Faustovirus]